jgi:hypothetical protein
MSVPFLSCTLLIQNPIDPGQEAVVPLISQRVTRVANLESLLRTRGKGARPPGATPGGHATRGHTETARVQDSHENKNLPPQRVRSRETRHAAYAYSPGPPSLSAYATALVC